MTAGDFLRRDGVCEQRGRFELDDGRFDEPGEAVCPVRRRGALPARRASPRSAVSTSGCSRTSRTSTSGCGWRSPAGCCVYEPAVALHAGGGSAWQLDPPVEHWIERNTLLLVAKAFPLRWAPQVAYRQLGWAWHAFQDRRLRVHLSGALAALKALPTVRADRRRLRAGAVVAVEVAVPERPIRSHTRRSSRR